MDRPYTKMQWKQIVYEEVHKYWKEHIIRISELYKHLGYLNINEYKPGKQHPLICIPISSVRDANRIPVKLKLVSGTYVFQANRANFNQNKVDATCLLCNAGDEDIEHFLLRGSVMDEIRNSTFHDMDIEFYKLTQKILEDLTIKEKIVIILDCFILLNNGTYYPTQHRVTIKNLSALEFHCRRYVYNLHSARYNMLAKIRTRKR